MKITINKKEYVLPDEFMWILFRHGEKDKRDQSRKSLLTEFGRKQVFSTAFQLLDTIRESVAVCNVIFFCSKVLRVEQSAQIALLAFGFGPYLYSFLSNLEWGPRDGHNNDEDIIRTLISRGSETVVSFGHNGLFENIAQIVHPREGGYKINPGEAFIITSAGVQVISPQM
jgi:phosphohistidine phosphatase SixA